MPSSPKEIMHSCSSVSPSCSWLKKTFDIDFKIRQLNKIAEMASSTILAQWSPTSYKYGYHSICRGL